MARCLAQGRIKVQFRIKNEDYFLTFVEEERRWYVFAPSPTGIRRIPVYVDAVKWQRMDAQEINSTLSS